jgi:hypothetical protein
MNMEFEDYGLRSYIAEASTQRVSPLMIKTNTTKRIRAFNKTALVNHAIRIISLQDKLDRIDNRQLFSNKPSRSSPQTISLPECLNFEIDRRMPCHVDVLLGPSIVVYITPAVVRKRAETMISHKQVRKMIPI